MRPSTSVLLHHEPMSAVLARVSYQLIALHYHKYGTRYRVPSNGLRVLAYQLSDGGFHMLATHIWTYLYYMEKGRSTAATKQWIVARSRWAALNRSAGKPWARVPAK